MDGRVMYLILQSTLLFSAGAALVAAFFAAKARFRRWWAYTGVKVGIVLTNTILLVRVFSLGEVEPTTVSYAYAFGMFFTAIFLVFVAGDMARRGGVKDAHTRVSTLIQDKAHQRVTDLEDRVTIEEARNTDIEELARAHKAGTEEHPSIIHEEEEAKR